MVARHGFIQVQVRVWCVPGFEREKREPGEREKLLREYLYVSEFILMCEIK